MAATTRVPPALVEVKPDAYIPQVVSLGPFHHRSRDLSRMEKYKLIPAARLDKQFKGTKSFHEIVESIKEPELKSKMEEFYYVELPEDFAWMMALDALFILEFLHNDYSLPVEGDHNGPFDIRSLEGGIKCDFLKLENQIPLFILERVYVEMGRPLKRDAACESRTLTETLKKACLALSPFVSKRPMDSFVVSFQDANHFLGLMHRHVSDLVEIRPIMEQKVNVSHLALEIKQTENISRLAESKSSNEFCSPCAQTCFRSSSPHRHMFRCFREEESETLNVFRSILDSMGIMWIAKYIRSCFPPPGDDFPPTYNVQELSKAGIKFKAFSSHSEKIRFEITTATLHLPVITISDTTEIILRNLLALEFNNPNGTKHVTRYVELMDCLIDTPKDISLLKKFGVIQQRSLMLKDADIAKRWNGMCKPFFAGFHDPPHELKDGMIKAARQNYWKNKIKNALYEAYQRYSSRPWQLLVLLCGIFIVLANATQTYCLFRECGNFKQRFPLPPGPPPPPRFPPRKYF
eukprot:Gb_39014 [translate_table: standard]